MLKFLKTLWKAAKMESPKIHREDVLYAGEGSLISGKIASSDNSISGIRVEGGAKFNIRMPAPNMFGTPDVCPGIRSMTMPCGRRIDFPAGLDLRIVSYAHAVLVEAEGAKMHRNRDSEDAKRYRYMRDHADPSIESWFQDIKYGAITKEQADAEIDLCIRDLG